MQFRRQVVWRLRARPKKPERNYAKNGHRFIEWARPRIADAPLFHRSYDSVKARGALIYCDPPYEATTGYSMSFDHGKFWNWVRQESAQNKVFVSSYEAPSDFRSVLEIPTRTNLESRGGGKSPRVEKVFQVR